MTDIIRPFLFPRTSRQARQLTLRMPKTALETTVLFTSVLRLRFRQAMMGTTEPCSMRCSTMDPPLTFPVCVACIQLRVTPDETLAWSRWTTHVTDIELSITVGTSRLRNFGPVLVAIGSRRYPILRKHR